MGYSDYKNLYLPSILHLYHHLFAELVHLYNLPLYWLLFPTLQKLGPLPKDRHWYVLCLNLKAKRFEVIDSLWPQDSPSLITHATKLMNVIKKAWLIAYKDSSKQIQDYDLVYIDVFKQDNGTDCGFFAFKILEFWDGKNIPTITQEQIPALRKILTSMWLDHPLNKCTQWRYHLFNKE
uniref:Ubiquitin-like protease family profile domain-containing protein n=1 Tax=Aegilops tauschii TaxID=37682 RepID=N1R4Y5_AEGTA